MINSGIFDSLEKYKNRIAVIEENFNKKSYKKLIDDSNIFNKNFLRKKVILILCENNYETIVAYLGLVRNKSIPYLIDNTLNKSEIINILEKYKINYIYLPKISWSRNCSRFTNNTNNRFVINF